MTCGLCGERIDPRHEEDAIRPGKAWPIVHVSCFALLDDEDEASSRTTTYHAQNQGDAMESLQ